MNAYQRVIINGVLWQPGHINTHEKFNQLVYGLDLYNKDVLDVGCNIGEMSRLAKGLGASYVAGIDCEYEYIKDALYLDPTGNYNCCDACDIAGNYDIIIASAMFHYIKDHDKFMNRLARVGKLVTMDVWVNDDQTTDAIDAFYLSSRELYIPTKIAFERIASKYFKTIKMNGPALSPDGSLRLLYQLSDPTPIPAKAIVVYGPGGSGKTTYCKSKLGFHHFQLDNMYLFWKVNQQQHEFSIDRFVDSIIVPDNRKAEYINFHKNQIRDRWLKPNVNRDIIIEGYDPVCKEYLSMLLELLNSVGWKNIEVIEATQPLWMK